MKSDDDIFKIYSELINIAENLNSNDILKEENNNRIEQGYKFKSRTRKGKYRRKFFLYILLPNKQNRVEILLDTGIDDNVIDKKGITTPVISWAHIKKKIVVTPEDINSGRKTYDDIEDLMNQCYRFLNLRK
jgi:hypothetical protein